MYLEPTSDSVEHLEACWLGVGCPVLSLLSWLQYSTLAVADLGGVRGMQMNPPFVPSNVLKRY